jgi:two-component system, response regulator YesN
MKQVMIVDDEPLTRYAIRKLISQNFPLLQVIDEADNGIDAIQKVELLKPDIVFMDIKMPGMNGIDAAKKILSQNAEIHIIILTAYDHFSFIQEALEIGIEGYLLKPISKGITIEKIQNIIHRIEKIDAINRNLKVKEQNMEAVIHMAQKDFVDQMISKNFDAVSIQEYVRFLNLNVTFGYFICIELPQVKEKLYQGSLSRERDRGKVIESINRYLPFASQFIIASPFGNKIVVFMYETDAYRADQYQDSIMIATNLIHKLRLIEKIQVKIGIGKGYHELEYFNESFHQALKALQSIQGDSDTTIDLKLDNIKHISNLEDRDFDVMDEYPIEALNSLKDKIQLGSFEECILIAHDVIRQLCLKQLTLPVIKEYCIQLVYDLKNWCIYSEKRCSCSNSDFVQHVLEANLLEEVESIIIIQVDLIINDLLQYTENLEKRYTQALFDYIELNYKKNISLDDLASVINKSSQYTSKLFKDIFNINFIDYLTLKRMDYAKELLLNSHYKIKDISQSVGYDDSNYFCRMFKKHTGLTPKEFQSRSVKK